MKNQKNPIICALDTNDLHQAYRWINDIKQTGCMVKVGLELFTGVEPHRIFLETACKNIDIFLDLKLYDIPNTVFKTIQNFIMYNNIKMLTVHGSGDKEMIKSSIKAAEHIDVIAVTLLTSTEEQDSQNIVTRITEKSLEAGVAGIVCSAKEVRHLRKTFGNDFKIIVPGVRPIWYKNEDDQKRTGIPRAIMNYGADFLVIGRPITTAPNMKDAIQKILTEIQK